MQKLNHPVEMALFLCHLEKSELRLKLNDPESAVVEVFMAIALLNIVDCEEEKELLTILHLKCQRLLILGEIIPLLCGVMAVIADKANEKERRDHWLKLGFQFEPEEKELMNLIDAKGWEVCIE